MSVSTAIMPLCVLSSRRNCNGKYHGSVGEAKALLIALGAISFSQTVMSDISQIIKSHLECDKQSPHNEGSEKKQRRLRESEVSEGTNSNKIATATFRTIWKQSLRYSNRG
eukprot:2020872-Amphidinium_carterae.1